MIPLSVAALFIHQPDLLHLLQWIPPPRMQHHVTLMLVHASSHVQSAALRSFPFVVSMPALEAFAAM
jgi:hypothetical protein